MSAISFDTALNHERSDGLSAGSKSVPSIEMHTVAAILDADDFLLQTLRHGTSWASDQVRTIESAIDRVLGETHGTTYQFVRPDEWRITFVGPEAGPLYDHALACLTRVQIEVRNASGLTASVGVSKALKGSQSASAAMLNAENAALSKLVRGGNQILNEEAQRESKISLRRVDREIARLVRAGDPAGVARLVARSIEEFAAQPEVTAVELQEWVLGNLLFIMDLITSTRTSTGSTDWLGSRSLPLRDLMEVSLIHERSYLQLWLQGIFDLLVPEAIQVEPSSAVIVAKAERYILDHFDDSGLHLEKLARAVSASPHHLAHLFRSERNSTYLRMLTGERMRAARRLLSSTDLPVQTIAELVGFLSAKRFRIVFKREIGCSPSAYRANS